MMQHSATSPIQWLQASVKALNDVGSWTGRIHVHKLLYIAQQLELAHSPFQFELYDYGPYSFELDRLFSFAEACGEVYRSYPKPGYGPKYSPGSATPPTVDPLSKVAHALGMRSSSQLELIATCLWVERRNNVADSNEIIESVRQLKPRYNVEEVKKALEDERRIVKELTTSP